jgi:circadian clock protein KaiC
LEELVADCVIELNNRVTNQIATRRLRILKYRGSCHGNNEYPFIIDENRMTVFPLIDQGLSQIVNLDRISTGISSLDEMMDKKGFFKGSSILVAGTAGTGKTSILASFVNDVCKNDMQCLFCAFEESPAQINRNMLSIGINLKKYTESKKLIYYYARPSIQNLELHFMSIKELINSSKADVIILDPITNLMTEGPNSDVRSMLTRFVDYLKYKNMTVMFSAAITIGSIEKNPSDEGISSMVDTWINLEDAYENEERITNLVLMKSRGMEHSKFIKRLRISHQGIMLEDLVQRSDHMKFQSAI